MFFKKSWLWACLRLCFGSKPLQRASGDPVRANGPSIFRRDTSACPKLPREFLEKLHFPLLTRYIPYQFKTLQEMYYILQKFDLTFKKISYSSLSC